MFIIWGWGGRPETIGTGSFFCPVCRCETEYDHRQMRTWFSFFFIPIIPMAAGQRYVQCCRCQGTFIEEILHMQMPQSNNSSVQAGERVLAKRGDFWYPGIVRAKVGKRFDVDFDDGKCIQVPKKQLFPLDLREGDPIFVRPHEGAEYQVGNITAFDDAARIQVQFPDGRREWTDLAHVRVIWEEGTD